MYGPRPVENHGIAAIAGKAVGRRGEEEDFCRENRQHILVVRSSSAVELEPLLGN